MKTFLLFIVAIGRHYFALVTGGVIMGLVWLGRDVGQLNIPNWVNPFLAVLFLLVAGFLAWADERKKSEIAEQRAQTAEEKLNSVRLKVDVADLEARQNLVLADKKIQALTEELSKNRKQATPYNLGDNLTGDVEIN